MMLAAIAGSTAASPNDTMVTLGAGGLVPIRSAQVVMESEDLAVSAKLITVTYRFRNETGKAIDATVGFPLPPLTGGSVENEPMTLPSKDPVNYVDFRVSADGVAMKPQVEVRAFDGEREVTGRLRQAGLAASVLAVRESKAVDRLGIPAKTALAKEKLIACDNGLQASCWPAWETRVQFYWTQRFPAGKTVTLKQSYRPVVGGSYIVGSMDGESNLQPYCGGVAGVAAIAHFKQRHPAKTRDDIVLWENRIDYILTTANNWSGPIRNFHLTIETESPEDLLFTCMSGLKRTAPARYELTHENFRPNDELRALILTGRRNAR